MAVIIRHVSVKTNVRNVMPWAATNIDTRVLAIFSPAGDRNARRKPYSRATATLSCALLSGDEYCDWGWKRRTGMVGNQAA